MAGIRPFVALAPARRRRVLPVTGTIRIEVGDAYVHFVSQLVRWVAGKSA